MRNWGDRDRTHEKRLSRLVLQGTIEAIALDILMFIWIAIALCMVVFEDENNFNPTRWP